MGRSELPPAERVRRRLATALGDRASRHLPARYQRLGRVLVLRLPEALRPHFQGIGEAWCTELGVTAVLRRTGQTEGELRIPRLELIAGEESVTEVVEYGIRYRLDARQVMFARGNRTERHRAGTVTRPGEVVADLFAGIGYFALPAAVAGQAARVWAVEKNPIAFRFLLENVALNRVADRVECRRGDNREVELPARSFDRLFLGYLPSAVPWLPRALDLLRPEGGTVHVHLVTGSREGPAAAEAEVVQAAERVGASVVGARSRVVKPYGPGRVHVVVDLRATPPPARRN
ncbi:MAG: class I SAM-dependent methyltransferase family protein [Thermoplasmata archaeon]|nr:class I SAM-dependent methyltransferase family protein [Thermoplasmata archaeon]